MPRQSSGELYPPNYEYAMLVLRFANAEAQASGFTFRYQLHANIHEALDPESDLAVWDNVGETWMTVSDILMTLDEEAQYWVNYQWTRIYASRCFSQN